jgi:GntR family transcriptional regulator
LGRLEGGGSVLNKDENLAYYIQIYHALMKRIEDRVYAPNTMLPSENELAKEFGVTRATVRNAIKILKEEDRIYTEKGKGSFVKAPSIEHSLFKFYSFGRDYANRNHKTETILIDEKVGIQCKKIASMLDLSKKENIIKIVRLRKMDQAPVILEYSYIPESVAPNILEMDLEKNSIYDLLEHQFGFIISRAKEYLDPGITDEYQSSVLEVPRRTPVFIVERTTYAQEDIPIEYRKSIIRSDKFRFFVDLY